MARFVGELRQAGFKSPGRAPVEITSTGDVLLTIGGKGTFSMRRHPGQLLLDLNYDVTAAKEELHELLKAEESASPKAMPLMPLRKATQRSGGQRPRKKRA